jgi:hypothetical protein
MGTVSILTTCDLELPVMSRGARDGVHLRGRSPAMGTVSTLTTCDREVFAITRGVRDGVRFENVRVRP